MSLDKVLPDLRVASALGGVVAAEEIDFWKSGSMELAFFNPVDAGEAAAKGAKRKRKKSQAKSAPRKCLYAAEGLGLVSEESLRGRTRAICCRPWLAIGPPITDTDIALRRVIQQHVHDLLGTL